MFEATPKAELLEISKKSGFDVLHEDFAKYLDDLDPLKEFRSKYHIPKNSDLPLVDLTVVEADETCVYLCGHSLGLQPKTTKEYIDNELEKWATQGVYGHAHVKDLPWLTIDENVNGLSAEIVGQYLRFYII
ncbi:kynureninase-like [Dendronephthya gigantea]|uniref:kynureninase-like n=1 Tax=Dendronephthya gigantea TaxID=151771 RepID=UPI00106D0CEB|nr:kynureninase-like [Dendronephthya gigantea]